MNRLGLTVPLDRIALARHGDWLPGLPALGYTDLWTAETAGHDAFSPLAVAAAWAPRMRLGTAIASVMSRGPALLAMSAAALAEAAPGRFVLGIGASSETIVSDWNDRPFDRPFARVRDTLRFLRRALAGERIDEAFETFAVRGFRLERVPESAPPIYVAALRERMLALAGREADGVLLGLLTREDVARVVSIVHGAAGGSERDVVMRLGVTVCDDVERARRAARRQIAAYLSLPTYGALHDWLGRAEALAPMRRAWRAGDREGAAAAVPDALADALFVHGSAQACCERIRAFVAAGVTTPILSVHAPGGDLRAALAALSDGLGAGSR